MEIEKPPFSIVRNGWGEFDINITIYFQDVNEEPVTKIHGIRIFHHNQNQRATLKKPVVNESYDEIVFNEPTEFFYHYLTDDPAETLQTQLFTPIIDSTKIEEIKPEENVEVKEDEPVPNIEDQIIPEEVEKEAEKDVEMQPEETKINQETELKQENQIEAEGELEEGEDIIIKSTYLVTVGANNEHTVDVAQFFEDHNDKADLKVLNEALKHLKEETEYLRTEVKNSEAEITEKKERLRAYDQ